MNVFFITAKLQPNDEYHKAMCLCVKCFDLAGGLIPKIVSITGPAPGRCDKCSDRTIEKQTPTETFAAAVDDDPNYPAIRVTINDVPAVTVEHVIEEDRVMVHVYSKDNDEPLHIDWRTGEVYLPEEWAGIMLRELGAGRVREV